MALTQALESFLRWIHIAAGIMWIGHLWFFNFVNAPFGTTIDGPTKQKVVPELMPRALYWFRWGAAWTWITGVLLLVIVFYHGGLMFGPNGGSMLGATVLVLFTFLVSAIYDRFAMTAIGKNLRLLGAVGFAFVAIMIVLYKGAGFTYRAYVIHVGTLFGTIMAYNVWMRIWPAQREIITATKQGTPPNADKVALAGMRSRHNTYLSVPLVWAMINSHTTQFSDSFVTLLFVIAAGWGAVYLLYSKAAKVKGF